MRRSQGKERKEEEIGNAIEVVEAMETPGAPKGKKVKDRPQTTENPKENRKEATQGTKNKDKSDEDAIKLIPVAMEELRKSSREWSADNAALRSDNAALQKSLGELKAELAELKALQSDTTLQKNMGELKAELAELKSLVKLGVSKGWPALSTTQQRTPFQGPPLGIETMTSQSQGPAKSGASKYGRKNHS
jgi:hypothetical protein